MILNLRAILFSECSLVKWLLVYVMAAISSYFSEDVFFKKQKVFFLHYLLFTPQVSCVLFLSFMIKMSLIYLVILNCLFYLRVGRGC